MNTGLKPRTVGSGLSRRGKAVHEHAHRGLGVGEDAAVPPPPLLNLHTAALDLDALHLEHAVALVAPAKAKTGVVGGRRCRLPAQLGEPNTDQPSHCSV